MGKSFRSHRDYDDYDYEAVRERQNTSRFRRANKMHDFADPRSARLDRAVNRNTRSDYDYDQHYSGPEEFD